MTTALARQSDVPLQVSANGNVTALSIVEVRPQVSSTVRTVHIKEGQTVAGRPAVLARYPHGRGQPRQGARPADARQPTADARRTLARSRDLLERNFISKSAVDTAQAKVDGFEATIRADRAAIEASRVAVSYGAIRATIGGRTGVINVFPARWSRPPAACRW